MAGVTRFLCWTGAAWKVACNQNKTPGLSTSAATPWRLAYMVLVALVGCFRAVAVVN